MSGEITSRLSGAITGRANARIGLPRTTPVYESYWRFAAQRQNILYKRLNGDAPPWVDDPILQCYRFTNAYRASDRVSQYLIRHVIYEHDWPVEDLVFRILFFKIFNKIETWEHLERCFGPLSYESFDFTKFSNCLRQLRDSGQPIYSAAYMMPSAGAVFGYERKHDNHLALLDTMMGDDLPRHTRSRLIGT